MDIGRAGSAPGAASRALVCAQAVIGILTLLWQVPLDLALAHQGGALIVLGYAVAHWRGYVGEYPAEKEKAAAN